MSGEVAGPYCNNLVSPQESLFVVWHHSNSLSPWQQYHPPVEPMIVCTKYLATWCLHLYICLCHHAGPCGLSPSFNQTPLLFQLQSCQWGCFLGSVLRHKAGPTLPHQSRVTHATPLTLLEGFYTNSTMFPHHSVPCASMLTSSRVAVTGRITPSLHVQGVVYSAQKPNTCTESSCMRAAE